MTGYRNHSRSPAPVTGRSNFPNVDALWDAATGPGPALGTPDTSRSVFQKQAVGIAQACQLFDDDVVAGHRYGAASKRPNFRQHLERRSESGDLREDLLGSADHLSVLDVVSGLVPRADQSPVLNRSARQVCAQMSNRRVTAKYLPSMFPMAYGPAPV